MLGQLLTVLGILGTLGGIACDRPAVSDDGRLNRGAQVAGCAAAVASMSGYGKSNRAPFFAALGAAFCGAPIPWAGAHVAVLAGAVYMVAEGHHVGAVLKFARRFGWLVVAGGALLPVAGIYIAVGSVVAFESWEDPALGPLVALAFVAGCAPVLTALDIQPAVFVSFIVLGCFPETYRNILTTSGRVG